MNFQFVENGKIDGVARKLIRSHVMKGKNVGKVRTRPTRKGEGEVVCTRESYAADLVIPAFFKSADGGEAEIISVPRAVGNSFSPFTFPCQMQPYMRGLIDQCKDEASVSTHILC
jgi:hypothetical protein